MPVPNGVVASSRDHPGKRARSTIDTTVSTTDGPSARIAQRLRMALFLITCVAAPPPIPFQAYVRAVCEHSDRLQRLEQELHEHVTAWRLYPVVEALQAWRGVQLTVAVTLVAAMGDLHTV